MTKISHSGVLPDLKFARDILRDYNHLFDKVCLQRCLDDRSLLPYRKYVILACAYSTQKLHLSRRLEYQSLLQLRRQHHHCGIFIRYYKHGAAQLSGLLA